MKRIAKDLASGTSEPAYLNEAKPVGPYTLMVRGTWDGATVQVQAGPEDNLPAQFKDVLAAAESADFEKITDLSPQTAVRLSISGAGASTSLSFWIG